MLLVTLLIVNLSEINRLEFFSLLILLIFVAVAIRLFIFTYPASMIGFDPDTFALSIQTIVQNGTTDGIFSNYYSEVPLFHIFTAIYAQIANIRVAAAMGIWPLIVGLVLPLTAVIFSLYLNFRLRSALVAGLLMTVLSNSVTFSYKPIPNLLAAVFFYMSIICVYKIYHSNKIAFVPANILLVGLIYSHKLHPMTIVLGLLAIVVISYIDPSFGIIFRPKFEIMTGIFVITALWVVVILDVVPSLLIGGLLILSASLVQLKEMNNTQSQVGNSVYRSIGGSLWIFLLLSGVLLFIQWTLLTNQAYSILVRTISPLLTETETVTGVNYQFEYAEPVTLGTLDIFYHHSDKLVIFLLTSIAWLYYFYRQSRASAVLLGFLITCLALVPFGLFAGVSGGLGAQRVLLAFSAVAIAISAAFLSENLNGVVKLVIVALIVIQIFSVGFVPDYPNSYRSYLTEEEVEAKEFGLDYVESTIHTDLFYASESVLPVTSRGTKIDKNYNQYTDNPYRSFGPELFRRELDNDKYSVMAFRLDIDVYRSTVPGARTLSWNPERTFDSSPNHKRIFDSGNVVYYSR